MAAGSAAGVSSTESVTETGAPLCLSHMLGQKVIQYKPLLDRAIELSPHKPQKCVILQRPQVQCTLTGECGAAATD